MEIVSIYNLSNVDFKDTYQRKNYQLRGISPKSPRGQKIGATAGACWLWFGDPDHRPDAKDGSVKTWGEELRRLEARHNEHVWAQIVAGNIFCPQLGRGAIYYSAVEEAQTIDETGMNLGEDEIFLSHSLNQSVITFVFSSS